MAYFWLSSLIGMIMILLTLAPYGQLRIIIYCCESGNRIFYPTHVAFNSAMVWVRILELRVEYFDSEFLMRIGVKIGHPVKVDNATI